MAHIDESNVGISDILRYLIGTKYPAGKKRLIRHAKGREAPKPVLEALEALPDRDYGNAGDVNQALGRLLPLSET